MKKLPIFALVLSLMVAGDAYAQQMTEADLTRAAIHKSIATKAPKARREAVRNVIAAIEALDIDDTEKIEKLITASRAMISASKDGNAVGVIAEIYTRISIEYLPAVSSMLMETGFGQKDNGLTDEQMSTFIKVVLKSCTDYMVSAGCDAPAARAGIMTAAFVGAAENQEMATLAANEALNKNIRTAALAYSEDLLKGSTTLLSEGSGVAEFGEKPAVDPDKDHIVSYNKTKEEAVREGAHAVEHPRTGSDDESLEQMKVPLISRFANDVSGIVSDTMASTVYDWEYLDPSQLLDDPLATAIMGVANVDTIPGDATSNTPSDEIFIGDSSVLYDGQR